MEAVLNLDQKFLDFYVFGIDEEEKYECTEVREVICYAPWCWVHL